MRRKRKEGAAAMACQLRSINNHPFGALRGFMPLGSGEERVYRELREAIPVLDAAVGKLVRLSGGFQAQCKNAQAQRRLRRRRLSRIIFFMYAPFLSFAETEDSWTAGRNKKFPRRKGRGSFSYFFSIFSMPPM